MFKKKHKEIIPTDPFTWNNVTISDYVQINKILNDQNLTNLQKSVSLVSIITGIPERDIYNLPIDESSKLISKLEFLNDVNIDTNPRYKTLYIGETKYEVLTDITKLTTAQFIDYQSLSSLTPEELLPAALSIFLIPEGKKYGEGYDITVLRKKIYEKLNFVVAQQLVGFIISKYKEYLETSLTYLERTQLTKTNQESQNTKLKEVIQKLRQKLNL